MKHGLGVEVRSARSEAPRREAWEPFLARLPHAGPFHDPAWREALLHAHPGLRDETLWLPDGAEIRAALPLLVRRHVASIRASSQPYGTAGGVWLRDPGDREAAVALVTSFARRFARPWNDCVMTDHGSEEESVPLVRACWRGARPRPQETHRLALPSSPEELERGYARRTRKALRRAASLGLWVESCAGEHGLSEFMAFQHREAVERRVRFTYPAALLRHGVERGWLRLYRARREGETLAVTAVAESRGRWFAWLVAQAPRAREAPTGEILFDALLRDAVARGCTEADFGSSNGRRGPAFFKEGFGARPAGYRVWRSGPLAWAGR